LDIYIIKKASQTHKIEVLFFLIMNRIKHILNEIMSQTVTSTQNVEAKKERKPTLSDKYSKFLVCNFNLIKLLETQGLLTEEGVEAAYSEIKLMSSVEEQGEYYEAFLAAVKGSKGNPGIKSQMKKFINQRNKPPKVPRAKKERKPKEEAVEGAAVDTKQKKERKPRAKKETTVSNDSNNDVVAELVEAANSSMEEIVEQPLAEPVKKARKPRTKKETVEAPVEAPVEAKKTKKSKAKKVEEPLEEEEESIHTNEFVLDGKTYLIDSDNNLYDINSHEEVGVYDATTSSIVA
jgi:hypothetical protein